MNLWKKILLILLLTAAVFVVLNFQFFWANLKFFLTKPQLTKDEQTKSPLTGEPDTLIIQGLGIKVPVMHAERVEEKHFQKLLQSGVVHYPGSAPPGEPGNVYIFGHSSDFSWSKGKYKTVFAVLPQIELGAEILLSDERGVVFVYRATEKFVTSPDDLSVLDQQNFEKKLLTLQTSYPVGTALRRYIVRAELTEDSNPSSQNSSQQPAKLQNEDVPELFDWLLRNKK